MFRLHHPGIAALVLVGHFNLGLVKVTSIHELQPRFL